MKIRASKIYSLVFILVIFLQLYLPSFKANLFIQITALLYYFLNEKSSISVNALKFIIPLLLILLSGFIGSLFYKCTLINVLKDIFHFTKPLIGISIGYFFFKKINDLQYFVKSVIIVALFSAIIHFFKLTFISELSTITGIRENSRDNFLELFSLFFLGFYSKFSKVPLFTSERIKNIIFFIIVLSCILYFSRTMVIVGILILLTYCGLTTLTKTTVKIYIGILFFTFGFYFMLFNIKINRNGQGIENFFYKIKIAPSELFETNIDRENHKDLWDHWRGYESKRAFALMEGHQTSYIFGMGYGSLVNLKFKAPLSDDGKGLKYISDLHNGYPYILYKTGIIGLMLYLFFLFRLYRIIYEKKDFCNVTISAIGIYFLVTTITITGIFNVKDTIVFILGAMIFFKTNKKIIW